VREAGIPALLPRHLEVDRLEAGAQTTMRAGFTRLVALSVRARSGAPLEVVTIVRAALLAGIPPAERGEADDQAFMREYLRREAASALAMRTLDLAEGAAYELTTPLDQLISARHAELPEPSAAEACVDRDPVPASRMAFGEHAATWTDLPAEDIAFIVYGTASSDSLELSTARP
jgi:hypothetical protein